MNSKNNSETEGAGGQREPEERRSIVEVEGHRQVAEALEGGRGSEASEELPEEAYRPRSSGEEIVPQSPRSRRRAEEFGRYLDTLPLIPSSALWEEDPSSEARRGDNVPRSSPGVCEIWVRKPFDWVGALESDESGLPAALVKATVQRLLCLRRLSLLRSEYASEASQNNLNAVNASSSRPPNEANMNVSGERDNRDWREEVEY